MECLWSAAFLLKAPDVGRCVSIRCKCIASPTAVRLLPGEGAKRLRLICRPCLIFALTFLSRFDNASEVWASSCVACGFLASAVLHLGRPVNG